MHSPLLLPLITLLFGALAFFSKLSLSLVSASPRTEQRISLVIAIAYLISEAYALYSLGGSTLTAYAGAWEPPLGIGFHFDALSFFGNLLLLFVAGLSLLYAAGSAAYSSSFFFYLFFLLAACQGILSAGDLFTLFIFFEILAIAAYMLIAYKKSSASLFASFRYLLVGTLSISIYLVAMFFIYRGTGTLSMELASQRFHLLNRGEQSFAAAGLLCGILTRSAIMPFHAWLPLAHSKASHPVSALLSGFVIKVPLILLLRITNLFPPPLRHQSGLLLLFLGLISALWGVVMALSQRDAKRLLAYSSISQIGFISIALGLGISSSGSLAATAVYIAFFHAFSHGVSKALLFLSVGTSCDRAGSRNIEQIRSVAGQAGLWFPVFLTAAGAIAGVPLLSGYTSKQLISSLFTGRPLLYLLILAISTGTAAAYIKTALCFFPLKGIQVKTRGLPIQMLALATAGTLILMGTVPGTIFKLLESSLLAAPSGLFPLLEKSYRPEGLLKQLGIVLSAALLCFLLCSRSGKRISHTLRRVELNSDGQLILLMLGFFCIYAIFWGSLP